MAINANRPCTVLIADSGDTLRPYAEALRGQGYKVETVTSGSDAVGRLLGNSIDVAVLDDELPDRTPAEVLRAIGRTVPIIVCSASWNVNRAVETMKAGACDYLPRPVRPNDLLRAVAAAVQGRGQRGEGRETRGEQEAKGERRSPSAHVPDPSPLFEQRRRQAQKMELFGRLAGGVIHDFNNLLTVILGYCDILKANLAPHHPLRDYVEEIDRVAVNGSGLTHQLLAFGRNHPDARTVSLNHVLARMETLLARLLGEHIRIILRPAADLGFVRLPLSQLEQIIMNLVVNARDAMPEGGTLTLETANLDLPTSSACASRSRAAAGDGTASAPLKHPPKDEGSLPAGRYIVLKITDTGCGMDEHTRAHLFEPFFTTKEEGSGTGLGLSIVASILQSIGGRIHVDTHLGYGTTFTLYLPRAHEQPGHSMPQPLHRKNVQGTSS